MSLLDKVSDDLSLYIGGLFTLRRKQQLQEAGITHVLSVLQLPLDETLFSAYTHKAVEADDVDDENLLQHFPACNRFIQDALDGGGAVLVHCAMGKSRSATVVCAYLMQHYGIDHTEALRRLREARPFCDPNEGFMSQLELYHRMGTPEDVEEAPGYQRWLYQREVEMSRACGQAPEAEKIRFEDEHVSGADSAEFELRCRKCRRPLAASQFLLDHKAGGAGSAAPRGVKSASATATAPDGCAHYFLDPLSWMRPELEAGKLDGRLECPKCRTNVGKYAWQGMQCSCGEWIVPGISLAKGRIDQVRARGANAAAAMGIRLPPSAASSSSSTSTDTAAASSAPPPPPPSTNRGPGHENL